MGGVVVVICVLGQVTERGLVIRCGQDSGCRCPGSPRAGHMFPGCFLFLHTLARGKSPRGTIRSPGLWEEASILGKQAR